MAAEVQLDDGSWTAFSAERTPGILGDAIGGRCAQFFMASQRLSSDELKGIALMAFPMTRHVEGHELIAKYPVDQWHEAGAPYLSAKSRRKLAMRVAKQDLDSLEAVFETAQKHSPRARRTGCGPTARRQWSPRAAPRAAAHRGPGADVISMREGFLGSYDALSWAGDGCSRNRGIAGCDCLSYILPLDRHKGRSIRPTSSSLVRANRGSKAPHLRASDRGWHPHAHDAHSFQVSGNPIART